MTVKGGLIALSGLALASLLMLVSSPNEAYRWVDQSRNSAIVLVVCALIGLLAAALGRPVLAFGAGAIALAAACVQFVGLADGGLIGGNGSTFALLLAVGVGFVGLGYADRVTSGVRDHG